MSWLKDKLDNHMLIRRVMLLITMIYVWHATDESKQLAIYALDRGVEWAGVAAIIGAYTGLPLAAIGYLFAKYDKSRREQ